MVMLVFQSKKKKKKKKKDYDKILITEIHPYCFIVTIKLSGSMRNLGQG